MQNYREANHAHRDVADSPHPALRQALLLLAAAIVVGVLLAAVALVGALLIPGERDCVVTDNAGCVSIGSAESPAVAAIKPEFGRGV